MRCVRQNSRGCFLRLIARGFAREDFAIGYGENKRDGVAAILAIFNDFKSSLLIGGFNGGDLKAEWAGNGPGVFHVNFGC